MGKLRCSKPGPRTSRRAWLGSLGAITAAVATGCADADAPDATGDAGPERAFTFFSWWTEGGEKEALDALLVVFRERSGVRRIENFARSGSEGARYDIADALRRNVPPDSFQAISGTDLLSWVRYNGVDAQDSKLLPIDDIAEDAGVVGTFDARVLDLLRDDGRLYGIPLGSHRTNNLYIHRPTFDRLKLEVPTTAEELEAVAEALSRAGETALAVSAAAGWTLSLWAWENALPAIAGGDFARSYFAGREDPSDPAIAATLAHVSRLLDHAGADADALSWSEAVRQVGDGRAAMTIMGDWARALLLAEGRREGIDFEEHPYPGTSGVFTFDNVAFGLPRYAQHPESTVEFLRAVASAEGQAAFNRLKGSVPSRNDTPMDAFDAASVRKADAFMASGTTQVPALAVATSFRFQADLNDEMATFQKLRDPELVLRRLKHRYALLR